MKRLHTTLPLISTALIAGFCVWPSQLHASPAKIQLKSFESPLQVAAPQDSLTDKIIAPPTPTIYISIDDGSAEGASGVNGANAEQFLWFTNFAPRGVDFQLEEVSVLFPSGANMSAGQPIDLVFYADNDGDPSNGANLLDVVSTTIQAADDSTFSEYPLASPVTYAATQDVLIGVIPRFIQSGVTSPTFPAAVDTDIDFGRSWIALWTGDPPAVPTLPSDGAMTQVTGNWMIRGIGTAITAPSNPLDIPTVSQWGLLLLIGLLTAAGVRHISRL